MSYQVLARKWRPHNFTEMVGQEHVLRALINALDQQRLHHAYLFAGTRGVGKTTIARILAKSLNCEQGISSTPCGQCSACLEIDQGRFVDLIEVDAASRTKVEDTRELLDNVQYSPTRGRYKVYLIDEVHMLSTHSFNALLKTLEEPPPHVKFLLATTDPQKLPATILSRCLQFKLKRMPLDQIVGHLSFILEQESIEVETLALKYLAKAADGSMRDALSLLDQAIAFGQGKVASKDVQTMLGDVGLDKLQDVLMAIASKDANEVIGSVEALEAISPDFESVLNDLLIQVHQLILAKMAVAAVDDSIIDRDAMVALAEHFSLEDLQLYYQIGLIGKRDLQLAPTMRSGFEMVLLRMLAFSPLTQDPNHFGTHEQRVARPAVRSDSGSSEAATVQPQTQRHTAETVSPPIPPAENDWKGIVNAMQLKGMVSELALNCILTSKEAGLVVLSLPGQHKQLYSSAFEERLAKALSEYYKESINLKIEIGAEIQSETPAMEDARLAEEKQQSAVDQIEQDSVVQAMKDKLGAQVQTNAVRPLD